MFSLVFAMFTTLAMIGLELIPMFYRNMLYNFSFYCLAFLFIRSILRRRKFNKGKENTTGLKDAGDSDDLSEEHLAQNLAEVEAKYNLALEEQKTEEEKSKAFRAQVLFYGLAFITLTFLILGFIFYKNYKLKEQNKMEQLQNNLN